VVELIGGIVGRDRKFAGRVIRDIGCAEDAFRAL
jgi:hypothetical protein